MENDRLSAFSLGLAVSKMLRMHQPHAKIYINVRLLRTIPGYDMQQKYAIDMCSGKRCSGNFRNNWNLEKYLKLTDL